MQALEAAQDREFSPCDTFGAVSGLDTMIHAKPFHSSARVWFRLPFEKVPTA
jgi:hypothetical protein